MQRVKTSSRIDPLGLELNAGPLLRSTDGGSTLDPNDPQALLSDHKRVLYNKRKGKDMPWEPAESEEQIPEKRRPSATNHHKRGGVTIEYALQVTIVSIAALRRLKFPMENGAADLEARTVIAALALCAATLAHNELNFRSRCCLAPDSDDRVAVKNAEEKGLSWHRDVVVLQPNPALIELIRQTGGGNGRDNIERDALEWLEQQPPPLLAALDAIAQNTRAAYVPANDLDCPYSKRHSLRNPTAGKITEKAIESGVALLPARAQTRSRRHFPSAWVGDAVCALIWPAAHLRGD